MRTTMSINENEQAAYQAFCIENRIALEGEAGEKNGALFADFIGVKMDADFTQDTLETAFESRLRGNYNLSAKTTARPMNLRGSSVLKSKTSTVDGLGIRNCWSLWMVARKATRM